MRKSLPLLFLSICLTLVHCNSQEKKTVYNPKAIQLNNKAVEFIKTANYDHALLYLDSAIHIDTTYYSAYANKCSIYCSLKDFKKALVESQMVISVKPDLAEGWTLTGMLCDWLGDTANALKCYQKSVEIFDERIVNPDKQKFLEANKLNRALSLILMGQEEEGRNELKKLKEALPDNKTVDGLLALTKKEYLEEQFGNR
jgi:tetratricopeptide (TPR) repeat protein